MYTDYFLDSENLGSKILDLIDILDKSDKLYIFYSDKSQHPSYEFVSKLMNSKCFIKLIECENGSPNSMDFKIVSFLGLKIGGYKNMKKNKHHYVILSADKGYDTTIDFYRSMNINVERKTCIHTGNENCNVQVCSNQQLPTSSKTIKKRIADEEVKVALSKNKMYDTIIRDCINQSSNVTMFHNMLQQSTNEYIRKHFSAIYRQYKQQFLTSKKA